MTTMSDNPWTFIPSPALDPPLSVGESSHDPIERPLSPGGTGPKLGAPVTEPWGVPTVAPLRGVGVPAPPTLPGPPAGRRAPRGTWRAAIAGGVVGALVATAVAFTTVKLAEHDAGGAARTTLTTPAAPGATLSAGQILAKVGPSVVAIEVELGRGRSAAGSGVVISADGLVLTNAHVVRGATTIAVKYADGTTQDADLVGSASSPDIALIRIRSASGLTPAVLGSSAALNVGDDVIAIGNALDLGDSPTVTRGIVSAKGRSLDNGEIQLENLLQTDAAINHGNSGGPLVDMQGEVVGINSAGIENTNNLGFAIEIDAVKPVIEDLKSGGSAAAIAYLGVQSLNPDELDPTTAEQLGVTGVTSGAIIVGVGNGSPAQTAGLRAGDVIVAIEGAPATSKDDVRKAIQARKPGDELTIEVQRDGQTRTVTATLGSRAAN